MTNAEKVRAPIRDLPDGSNVDIVVLVREREVRTKKAGGEYGRLLLSDKTGSVEAKIWDNVEVLTPLAVPGTAVRVAGRYTVDPKYGPDINVTYLRAAKDEEIDMGELLEGPDRPVEELEAGWHALVGSVKHPQLERLLQFVFDIDVWDRFRAAPAARRVHQAYRHGLLEHTLAVARAVAGVCEVYPELDRDVAVTGALLHDIGKLQAYTPDPLAIDYTTRGNLYGEIPLGYYHVRQIAEGLQLKSPKVGHVLHVILSHHGQLEWGSPVTPATREALVVHFMDNLGGRLGSFERLRRALPEGAEWSDYDRALGARAFFGEVPHA